MLNPFGKKAPLPAIRDTLFGDVPISQWAAGAASPHDEPWSSFVQAREHLASGRPKEAIRVFHRVLAMPDLESRHYAQAWHFLREAGVCPDAAVAKKLYGVIVEVGLADGLDIVAAYADRTARYFNHSGAAVVWDAPDDSLRIEIEDVLRAGKAVVDRIGPWEEPRPPAPATGQARINMLTPSGLHFGQASFQALAADALGGPVVSAATRLMQSLIAKAEDRHT